MIRQTDTKSLFVFKFKFWVHRPYSSTVVRYQLVGYEDAWQRLLLLSVACVVFCPTYIRMAYQGLRVGVLLIALLYQTAVF